MIDDYERNLGQSYEIDNMNLRSYELRGGGAQRMNCRTAESPPAGPLHVVEKFGSVM